jgi:hypothetical protein
MQWHWGNIGSAAAGLAALIATVAAVYGVIRYGPAWLRDSRERQQAQAAAAREQEALAREEQEQLRLDRHRHLYGWSRHGVNTYGVVLVTAAEEMDRARDELTGGGPSAYLVLRVSDGLGDVNRALSLRQLAETEGALSRPPTAGELRHLRRAWPRWAFADKRRRAPDRSGMFMARDGDDHPAPRGHEPDSVAAGGTGPGRGRRWAGCWPEPVSTSGRGLPAIRRGDNRGPEQVSGSGFGTPRSDLLTRHPEPDLPYVVVLVGDLRIHGDHRDVLVDGAGLGLCGCRARRSVCRWSRATCQR